MVAKKKRKSKPDPAFVELEGAALKLLRISLDVLPYIPNHLLFSTRGKDGPSVTLANDEFERAVKRLAKVLNVKLVSLRQDGCMWNPKTNEGARPGDQHNKRTPATVLLGAKEHQLCEECSRLPTWRRMKKRKPIERPLSQRGPKVG